MKKNPLPLRAGKAREKQKAWDKKFSYRIFICAALFTVSCVALTVLAIIGNEAFPYIDYSIQIPILCGITALLWWSWVVWPKEL